MTNLGIIGLHSLITSAYEHARGSARIAGATVGCSCTQGAGASGEEHPRQILPSLAHEFAASSHELLTVGTGSLTRGHGVS